MYSERELVKNLASHTHSSTICQLHWQVMSLYQHSFPCSTGGASGSLPLKVRASPWFTCPLFGACSRSIESRTEATEPRPRLNVEGVGLKWHSGAEPVQQLFLLKYGFVVFFVDIIE